MAKAANSNTEPVHDVAVVGGGAAGLAVLLGLERAGLKPVLVGAVPNPRDDGRTAALMAPSVRLLDRIGALPRLEPKSTPLSAMRLIDATGALVRAPTVTFRASEVGLPWFALNFANADLVREMTAEAAHRGLDCIAEQVIEGAFGEDCARLVLADGQILRARLVIAADGQKSLLRGLAGLNIKSWTYAQTALTFHVTHSRDHEDISTEIHMRAGPLTFVPFGAYRSAVVWLVTPDEAERLRALPPEDLAIAVQRASTSLLGDLTVVTPAAAVPMRGLV
ncbi:MAG TPA: FAD-dependent monooxygenase, partial [Beijerinckiaceae bacterium]|nr:FAD-dependent monooxygenase [Beijerinckiaceae bacterium]